MTKDQLIEKLKSEFGDNAEITTLGAIASKIAVVSKVRIGEKREVTDYYEVSLNNIDEYGNIFIPDDATFPEPASKRAIRSQSLNHGDLLLNQRSLKIKVGFVSDDYKCPCRYKVPIVGNNSMIRIQFGYNDIDISRFVQLYLQMPYVKEYLDALPSTSKSNRKIISSAQLSELPIPRYIKNSNQLIELQTILKTKTVLLKQAKLIRDAADRLIKKYEKQKMDSAKMNFTSFYCPGDQRNDEEEMEGILELVNSLKEFGV